MATTNFREDHLGRNLIAPTSTSVDYLARATTSTVDYLGRPLKRILRANSTAYAVGAYVQNPTTGEEFTVTTAGTSASSVPTAPEIGEEVTDGTAVFLRTA